MSSSGRYGAVQVILHGIMVNRSILMSLETTGLAGLPGKLTKISFEERIYSIGSLDQTIYQHLKGLHSPTRKYVQLVHVHQFLAWASYSIARQFNHIITVYWKSFIACKCSYPVILQVQKRVVYQADSPRHIFCPRLSHDGSDTFFLSVSVHSFFFAPFTSELSQLPKRCMYWKRKKNECEICIHCV